MASSEIIELTGLEEFRRRRAAGRGVFVIVGRPSGRVLVHDVTCPFMTDEAFVAKTCRATTQGAVHLGTER
jgi:hypothetical protein